nr:peptide-N(4)-(N-acetyl-beta-glucosaminyl)asparagine amidase-like [Onthophagus taurus]
MSNLQQVLSMLKQNTKEHYKEVERLLEKVINNILKDPKNVKLRTLKKSNVTVSQKILKSPGGVECLKLMGFQESDSDFTLPLHAPLQHLELIKENISVENVFKETPVEKVLHKVELPKFSSKYTNKFLQEVEHRFHLARIHDDVALQEQAKELIREAGIEAKAIQSMRSIQKNVLAGDLEDPNISMQDVLLSELLAWFKNDFFSWVDSPKCEKCDSPTKFSHMSTDSELLKYTDRVEIHNCTVCNASTPFARFNDLNILLATRKGRCGEWANTFTLFCRAMGWEARHVYDETDHVWTEVYSVAQKRWLHCDSCEAALDTPLMYESGWNKKLSYIIAYSGEDLQDVTWRYSSRHKEVLSRRKKCTEIELVSAICSLRNERQKGLSETRREYLNKRVLCELIEMMVEKEATEKDKKGRTSGSMAWRLSRGETKRDFEGKIWKISDTNIFSLKYCTSLDQYLVNNEKIKNFSDGVFKMNGVFRKEEKDWRNAYLCREETVSVGSITWAFQVDFDQKSIDEIIIYFDYTTYEDGNVTVSLNNENKRVDFIKGQKELKTFDFSNSKYIEITATLTGGSGSVYWQHAQLFRQSLDSEKFPFTVEIKLK